MVVRGLIEKPARIDTPIGTLADFGNYFTPKLSRRVLHQLYLGLSGLGGRPRRRAGPARAHAIAAATTAGQGGGEGAGARPVKRAVRLVPGVHW